MKWHLLKEKKDVKPLVCGFELQEGRLRKLGYALRAAHLYGFTNGLAKAVIWRMVDLVMDEGLCEKHQMRMHV